MIRCAFLCLYCIATHCSRRFFCFARKCFLHHYKYLSYVVKISQNNFHLKNLNTVFMCVVFTGMLYKMVNSCEPVL